MSKNNLDGLRREIRFDFDEHETYMKLAVENKEALLEAMANVFNDAELEGHDELSPITSILIQLQKAAGSQTKLKDMLRKIDA